MRSVDDLVNTGRPLIRRRARLFATRDEEPRARRATDVILLVGAATGLALLSLVVSPPSGFEQALITLVRALPTGLDGLWQLLVDLLALAAGFLVVASLARRRFAVLRDLVLAVVLALAASSVVGRVVQGTWPALWESLRTLGPSAYPSIRLAASATVVMTAAPHLSQPARRLGWWLVLLGAIAVVLLGAASPVAATAGLLMASACAAVVHLALGSSRGRPSLDDVAVALRGLGVETRSLGAADRQREGVFLVDAVDEAGDPLVVKVYGRDAADTQLLTTLWRTVWYREPGTPLSLGRLHQAEHEAFLTLLARQAGILTHQVVTAGATVEDDVLLALRPTGVTLASQPDRWSPEVGREAWQVLATLHASGIAHGQLDDRHLVVGGDLSKGDMPEGDLPERDLPESDQAEAEPAGDRAGDRVGLIDFRGAAVAPEPERLLADEAQLLVTTALALGPEPAIDLAIAARGTERVAELLPFVQLTALTTRQRDQVRAARLELDELRDTAAARAGVEAPELQRMRRVTWGSVLQVVLLVVAFLALASFVGGLDLEDLGSQLSDATWGFVVVGLLLAQLPRLSQAVSTSGASPTPVPLGPVYALQLASSYIGLAVPTSAARIAVNIRFFQRQGLPAGSAMAVGALDGAAGFIVQAVLLAGILLLTPLSLEIDLHASVPSGLVRLVSIVVAIGLAGIGLLLVVPHWRRIVFGWLRRLAVEAWGAARGLHAPRRLAMLFGGNLASEILFAAALGAFARALGFSVGLPELLLINISVSLLSGLLPIPGGIGVVEGGLTFGLVRAGMPEETAFVAVLLYRLATFYLPPIWGFFALRWLERTKHL